MTIRDSTIAKLQQLLELLLQEVSYFIHFTTQKYLAKIAESQNKKACRSMVKTNFYVASRKTTGAHCKRL